MVVTTPRYKNLWSMKKIRKKSGLKAWNMLAIAAAIDFSLFPYTSLAQAHMIWCDVR